MQGQSRARWLELCEQAANEPDTTKLLELVKQINDLLSEKRHLTEPLNPVEVPPSVHSAPINTRILLADDSRAVRGTMKTLLGDQYSAWEICEAENGSETLEKVRAGQPALVLLDLNLPDIPGDEVARQIRQFSPITKIIICSFSDPHHLAAVAEHAGADGYFTKGSDDLQKTIASVLTRS